MGDRHECDVPRLPINVPRRRITDVNVASRLLLDVLGKQVDAAIVISNDSFLRTSDPRESASACLLEESIAILNFGLQATSRADATMESACTGGTN